MRWRVYIFFLSATAAFCFMLLTAATDHDSDRGRPILSALLGQTAPAAAPDRLSEGGREPPARGPASLNALKPDVPEYFLPSGRDSAAAAAGRAVEREAANRGVDSGRRRLKWDGDGWHREETALVTAYCPCAKCCGSFASGTTSIGKNAWLPGLAADPSYLDYGTRVYVPGYGLALIDDTGGAMRRHWRRDGLLHIDVRMTFHYEARQWGSRYIRVKIYEN